MASFWGSALSYIPGFSRLQNSSGDNIAIEDVNLKKMVQKAVAEPFKNIAPFRRLGTVAIAIFRAKKIVSICLSSGIRYMWCKANDKGFIATDIIAGHLGLVVGLSDTLIQMTVLRHIFQNHIRERARQVEKIRRDIEEYETKSIDSYLPLELTYWHQSEYKIYQIIATNIVSSPSRHFKDPHPTTLVASVIKVDKICHLVFKNINRIPLLNTTLKISLAVATMPISMPTIALYRWYFEEWPTNTVERFIPRALWNDYKGNYRSPAERMDDCFMQAVLIKQGVVELPEDHMDPLVKIDSGTILPLDALLKSCKDTMQNDVNRFMNNVAYQTLSKTRKERIKFIEAVEGMMLRISWDIAAKNMPSAETCLREITLSLLLSGKIAPLGLSPNMLILPAPDIVDIFAKFCGDGKMADTVLYLPSKIISRIPTIKMGCANENMCFNPPTSVADCLIYSKPSAAQSLMHNFSNGATKIVDVLINTSDKTGAIATSIILSNTIEHSPVVIKVVGFEMQRWIKDGNKKIKKFNIAKQIINFASGRSWSDNTLVQDFLKVNEFYLLAICTEFASNTLLHMCRNKNLPKLLQLGLANVISSCLKNNTQDATQQEQHKVSRTHNKAKLNIDELPGMNEAITTLRTLLHNMEKIFFNALVSEIIEELQRQGQDGRKVFSNGLANQQTLVRRQAEAINAWTNIPAGVIESGLFLPQTTLSAAIGALGSLIQKTA